MTRAVLILAMLIVLVVGARPPLAVAADPRAVDELLALSGAKRQIEQLNGHIATHRKYSYKSLPPETKGRLDAIFEAAYDPPTILADVRNALLQEFDDRRGALVLGFLRSPLARAMTQLEVDADAPEAEPELRAFALRLRSTPPDPARLALVQRLDAAARQTELSMAFTRSSLRSFAAIANVALPPDQRRTPEQAEKELAAARTQLERMAKETVSVRGLFTYRSVADDDLRTYVEFHESEMGRWFMDLLTRALVGALDRSTATAARRALDEIHKEDDRRCVGLPCRPTS
jgi:hypothetical protein